MRGQEPGSEHDRREADRSAAPATPPPSFGQTNGRDVPSAFTPSEEVTDAEPHSVVPVIGRSPEPEEPPGAQSWEVPSDESSAYDWFADDPAPDETRPGRLHPPGPPPATPHLSDPARQPHSGPQPHPRQQPHSGPQPYSGPQHFGSQPPSGPQPHPGPQPHSGPQSHSGPHPTHPGPQPGLSAHSGSHPIPPAHSGPQPIHPAPTNPQAGHFQDPYAPQPDSSDQTRPGHLQPPPHDVRPWNEPVVPGAPPWEPPPAFTAAAAGMPVWPAPVTDPHAMPPWPAATGELEAEPDADEPSMPPPFDPSSTNPEGFTLPALRFTPNPQQEATQPPSAQAPGQSSTNTTGPNATGPTPTGPNAFAPPPTDQHPPGPTPTDQHQPPQPETHEAAPETTDPTIGQHPMPAPVATDPHPFAHDDITRPATPPTQEGTKPAHYFDPHAADTTDSANPTNPSVRPPEPGDVPVWPPNPPTGDKLPELPFPRETWGQKPTTSLDLPKPPGGGPAFPPGAFKQPPFQTPPPPPPASPGKSKRALFVTLGALALAGVAAGGFFAYQAVTSPKPTTAAARPSEPVQQPSADPAGTPPSDAAGSSMLNSEDTDPETLSLSEAFPKKKVTAAGTTFTRVKADMETACDKAATGAFADALTEQQCSRVLRATYVDNKRRYAITTGIAVLPTKEAAASADQAKDLSRNVWFRPLPGAAGSGGERVHIAGGYAAGLVWGRYIVFSYATHTDGHTPKADDKTLPKFSGAFRDQASLVLERRITKG